MFKRTANDSPSPPTELGDLSHLGSDERNLPEGKGPQGPNERARVSHWAGVRWRVELNLCLASALIPTFSPGEKEYLSR
jgi:hypothetical protein